MRDLTKIDSLKGRSFLAAFAECGNVTQAAEEAGCSRMLHYDLLENNEEYRLAFAEAKEAACDKLEAEARRRAVKGVQEAVYYQGKKVGTQLRYSDNLLMFMLKGERPDKFKERTEHTGPGGGPLQLSAIPYDEIDKELKKLEELNK